MSIFIGKDNNQNPLVHSTSGTRSRAELATGNVLSDTLFNSKLPYILVDSYEVDCVSYAPTTFRYWYWDWDASVLNTVNVSAPNYVAYTSNDPSTPNVTPHVLDPSKRVLMKVIIPTAVRNYLLDNRVVLVEVFNKATGKSYVIEDSFDIWCGGGYMGPLGIVFPAKTEVFGQGSIKIVWSDFPLSINTHIGIRPPAMQSAGPFTNPSNLSYIPEVTLDNSTGSADPMNPNNNPMNVITASTGRFLKPGSLEGILQVDLGYGDNNASNWQVRFHVTSLKLQSGSFLNTAVPAAGSDIFINKQTLRVGNTNLLQSSILRAGNFPNNAYVLGYSRYGGLLNYDPWEGNPYYAAYWDSNSNYSRNYIRGVNFPYSKHTTYASDGTFLDMYGRSTSSTGISHFSIWKGSGTSIEVLGDEINIWKNGTKAPFFNKDTSLLYRLGNSLTQQLDTSVFVGSVSLNTNSNVSNKITVDGPVFSIGTNFTYIIYTCTMPPSQVMVYKEPYDGIYRAHRTYFINPSQVEVGRCFGLAGFLNIGDKKIVATVTMQEDRFVAGDYHAMGLSIKYTYYLEKINSTQLRLRCDAFIRGRNESDAVSWTVSVNRVQGQPIEVTLATIG